MNSPACNIDGREVARRRRTGRLLLILGYAAVLPALFVPTLVVVAITLAAAGGIVATQARRRTCIGYALAGLEGDDTGVRRIGYRREVFIGAARVAAEGLLFAVPLLPFLLLLAPR
jgi:hypothetical protein